MRYTDSHEWVSLNGKIATIGVSDHAQKELGEIVFIELPKVGALLEKGKEACVLESTKAAADIYAPLTGKVVEVNVSLKDSPSILNHSAESDGWIYKLEISDQEEFDHLMTRDEYLKQIQ